MPKRSDHHAGLQQDLQAIFERRQFLLAGSVAAAAGVLSACDWIPGMSQPQPEKIAMAEDGGECVLHPTETAGPFPADGSNNAHGTLSNVLANSGIKRKDLRFDLGDAGEPADGVPMELKLKLLDVKNSCAPVANCAVYLWHCDAEGNYSIYNLPDHSYLRGVGVSDQDGWVEFTTIVPGCYQGRFPHMHFEVYPSLEKATDYRNRILTSQLAVPADVCRAAYSKNTTYVSSIGNFENTELDRDGIFADNTPKQLAAQTIKASGAADSGYLGEVIVGLEL